MKGHFDFTCIVDHMVICDDIAAFSNNNPGPSALCLTWRSIAAAILVTKEILKHIFERAPVWIILGCSRHSGFDMYNRWGNEFSSMDEIQPFRNQVGRI